MEASRKMHENGSQSPISNLTHADNKERKTCDSSNGGDGTQGGDNSTKLAPKDGLTDLLLGTETASDDSSDKSKLSRLERQPLKSGFNAELKAVKIEPYDESYGSANGYVSGYGSGGVGVVATGKLVILPARKRVIFGGSRSHSGPPPMKQPKFRFRLLGTSFFSYDDDEEDNDDIRKDGSSGDGSGGSSSQGGVSGGSGVSSGGGSATKSGVGGAIGGSSGGGGGEPPNGMEKYGIRLFGEDM